jgi:4-alpha-glucanotransferase
MKQTGRHIPVLAQRRTGVLLHPTSLPSANEHGDLGHDAYRFVEFLAASGASVWQVLPLGPTHSDGSPYQCLSVHAGNPQLICLDWLVDRGWLAAQAVPAKLSPSVRRDCLARAFRGFQQHGDAKAQQAFEDFKRAKRDWLDDYALFQVIRSQQKAQGWLAWPVALRDRNAEQLAQFIAKNAEAVEEERFIQYVFFYQWLELRDYAHQHGVLLFGDMPIFVAHDSADVWANREYFQLDEAGQSKVVAGVPPDYFSATGQLWGNPHYDWAHMKADGFAWWVGRMHTQLELFDLIRIDHFRGFEAYWEIDAAAKTAVGGHWVKAPGEALLQRLYEAFHELPLVAEDLGIITPEVEALRDQFHLPGMKILQFAFGSGPQNPYLPHNCVPNSVIYTGTHDNDTTVGWYESCEPAVREALDDYLACSAAAEMPWPLIRTALASVSRLAVLPMQDLLELDSQHRMNIPGTSKGNWQWGFDWLQLPADLARRLRHLNNVYGRIP